MAEMIGGLNLEEMIGGLSLQEMNKVLNLVLLGKIGSGKSASGNTILGRQAFESKESFTSVTQDVAVESGIVCGQRVTVYDTPGLFNSHMSEEEIQQIYANVLQRCESGPCVFLLVIRADRFTEEEIQTVEKIEKLLGEERLKKTWILFTGRDELEEENTTIKEFIKLSEPLKNLIQKYNQRYHVFNNKKREPNGQVQELLTKIYATYPDTIEKAQLKQSLEFTPVSTIPATMRWISSESSEMTRMGWRMPLMIRKKIAVPACEASPTRLPTRQMHLGPATPDELFTSGRIVLEKGAKPKRTLFDRLKCIPDPMSQMMRWMPEKMFYKDSVPCIISPEWLSVRSKACDDRRIVLLGQTGVGKSAAGNTILARREFKSIRSTKSVTRECSLKHATVSGRSVSVVDTPGLYNTEMSPVESMTEIIRSVYISRPGPHAFLIVFRVDGRVTDQELLIAQIIEMMFGEELLKYSIILFTHGDLLEGYSVERVIQENSRLRDLVQRCGDRFHVFSNRDENNRDQVNDLLKKIDTMIEQNGGGHYINQMYEDPLRFRQEEERKQCDEKQRQEDIERVIKETEERVRAEFEGPPRFLLERLKSMRLRDEDMKRREKERQQEFERFFERLFDPLHSSRRPKAIHEEIEFHKDVERQRKQREEKRRQEEIERVIKETEEEIRAEFEGPPRFLQERLKAMRLREEEERKQREEKQVQVEIERVRNETERRVRAEFEGPPKFLQERLEALRLREEEERKREEKRREFERGFCHLFSSMRRMEMRLMEMSHMEMQRKLQEEIERVIKETEEKIRAEFEGPPR